MGSLFELVSDVKNLRGDSLVKKTASSPPDTINLPADPPTQNIPAETYTSSRPEAFEGCGHWQEEYTELHRKILSGELPPLGTSFQSQLRPGSQAAPLALPHTSIMHS